MNGALIVGAGQAAVQIAASLRDAEYAGPITIVGAEAHLPYQRPPLSKEFLQRRVEADALELRTSRYYETNSIDVLCGDPVVRISLETAMPTVSGVATTSSGREIEFDKLALATGAEQRRLRVPGVELDGVCYLRVIEDALRLREAIDRATDVVVVGGGFIGLEAAASARSAGKRVTVLEAADRLVPRSVAPVTSQFLYDAHIRRGTTVRVGAQVTAIVGEGGSVRSVELDDGSRIPADVVIVGVGVRARTDLARPLGIQCDHGIVVDRFARTSLASVVAAGDCTAAPNPLTGEGRFRLESTQNAIHQGRIAAATLLGDLRLQPAVPWFWSDQFNLKLQIAGLAAGHDDFVVRGNVDIESFSVLYYRADVLVAADAVNQARDYLAVRAALAKGWNIPKARANDTSIPLRDMAQPKT